MISLKISILELHALVSPIIFQEQEVKGWNDKANLAEFSEILHFS